MELPGIAQVTHNMGSGIDGAIQYGDAAIGKMRDDLGLEKEVGRVQRRVGQPLPEHVDIIGNARRSPHVGYRVAVTRIEVRP